MYVYIHIYVCIYIYTYIYWARSGTRDGAGGGTKVVLLWALGAVCHHVSVSVVFPCVEKQKRRGSKPRSTPCFPVFMCRRKRGADSGRRVGRSEGSGGKHLCSLATAKACNRKHLF